MPRRRAVLAGLGAALAGCGEIGPVTPTATSTATPPPTETPIPFPDAVASAFVESRFDHHIACPAAVPCFHRFSRHAEPETVVVPDVELATPAEPTVTTTTYNLATEPLVLADPAWTGTWTDIHWPRTAPADVPAGVVVVEPGETLERTFHLDERGDGTYAVVETGYFGEPREPPTVDPEGEPSRLRGETFRFGALFEVQGSDWAIEPDDDVATVRDGSTLQVAPDRPGTRELVLAASDDDAGLPVVPESVAAHPPTKNAIFGLTRDGIETVRMPTDGTAPWWIRQARIFPVDPDPERTLRLNDVLFHLREPSANR